MIRKVSAATAALAIAASAVFAGSHSGGGPFDAAIKARQAHMTLYAHNIGIMGGMAKGAMDYNADLASVAATNLATLAGLNQMTYWPEGSDSENNANTAALPKAWANIDDIVKKSEDLAKAAMTLQAEAGNGLDALRAAIGPVGEACGACHKAYRKPKE